MQGVLEQNRTNMNTLARWAGAACRSAVFMRPGLSGLHIGPVGLVLLTVLLVAGGAALQRLFYWPGPVQFYWQAVGSGGCAVTSGSGGRQSSMSMAPAA